MDPYLILGVSKTDSLKIIKKKYKKLCLLYHPDKINNNATKEHIEERKMMFQNITLAYEKIVKSIHNDNDIYQCFNDEFSNDNIEDIINLFFKSIYQKINIITDHPFYRIFTAIGIKGILSMFKNKTLNQLSIVDIDISIYDFIGNSKIEFDYRSLQNDHNGKVIEKVNHICVVPIYPFVLCKNMGDFDKDLVINFKIKDNFNMRIDHNKKIIFVRSLPAHILSQKINTQFGFYQLQKFNN